MVERLRGLFVVEMPNIANEVFKLISPNLLQNITDHHIQLLHEFQVIIREISIARDPTISLVTSAARAPLLASALSGQPENQALAAEADFPEDYDAFPTRRVTRSIRLNQMRWE